MNISANNRSLDVKQPSINLYLIHSLAFCLSLIPDLPGFANYLIVQWSALYQQPNLKTESVVKWLECLSLVRQLVVSFLSRVKPNTINIDITASRLNA